MDNTLISIIEEFSQKAAFMSQEEINSLYIQYFGSYTNIDLNMTEYINSRILFHKNNQSIKIKPEDLPVGVMATMIKTQQKKVNFIKIE